MELGIIQGKIAPCLDCDKKLQRWLESSVPMDQERTCSDQDTLRHVDEVKRQVRAAGKDVELDSKFNMTLQVVVG